MKYLKLFESVENLKFSDIVLVLDDFIDEGYDITIISGDGHSFKQDGVINNNNPIFKFKRWKGSNDSFSIKISFNKNLDYTETIDILNKSKSFIGRFDDLGFYLYKFWIFQDEESDAYQLESIEYKFEAYSDKVKK